METDDETITTVMMSVVEQGVLGGSAIDRVYLSGMPFLYRGYNGAYELDPQSQCYHRKDHGDYYGIPIKATRLCRDESGRWRLQHRNPTGYENTHFVQTTENNETSMPCPIGEWTYGVMVTRTQNWQTWIRSNLQLFFVCFLMVAIMFVYSLP